MYFFLHLIMILTNTVTLRVIIPLLSCPCSPPPLLAAQYCPPGSSASETQSYSDCSGSLPCWPVTSGDAAFAPPWIPASCALIGRRSLSSFHWLFPTRARMCSLVLPPWVVWFCACADAHPDCWLLEVDALELLKRLLSFQRLTLGLCL